MDQFIAQFIWEGTQVLCITLCIPSIPLLCTHLRARIIIFSPLEVFYSSSTGHSIDLQCSYTACPKRTLHIPHSPSLPYESYMPSSVAHVDPYTACMEPCAAQAPHRFLHWDNVAHVDPSVGPCSTVPTLQWGLCSPSPHSDMLRLHNTIPLQSDYRYVTNWFA